MSRRQPLLKPTVVCLAIALALPSALAARERKGDANAGRKYTETWCTSCHAVDAQSRTKEQIGPDYTSVAKRRSTTAQRVVRSLYARHRNMPDFEIELDDATDVAAYILSLKRR